MKPYKKIIDGELLSEEECYLKHGGLIGLGVNRVIAGRHIEPYLYEDMMSEGTIGLIQAYRGFDHTKGFRFSTYAVRTIWGVVMTYHNNKATVIRRNRNLMNWQVKMGDDLTELSASELAKKYNLPIEEVDIIRGSFKTVVSLEYTIYETDSNTGEDTLLSVQGEYDDASHLDVEEFEKSISDIQRTVLHLRQDGYGQGYIAKQMGVSQPQISRILTKIKKQYLEWEKLNFRSGST